MFVFLIPTHTPKEFPEQLRKDRVAVVGSSGSHVDSEVHDIMGEELAQALGVPFDPKMHNVLKAKIVGRDPVELLDEDMLPLVEQIIDILSPADRAKLQDPLSERCQHATQTHRQFAFRGIAAMLWRWTRVSGPPSLP